MLVEKYDMKQWNSWFIFIYKSIVKPNFFFLNQVSRFTHSNTVEDVLFSYMFFSELSLDREENHSRRDSLVLENLSHTMLSLVGEEL